MTPERGIAEDGAGLRWRRTGAALALLAAVAAALRPLADPALNFFHDWHVHQWLVGYFGEHLRAHLSVPETINAPGAVGMPHPVFYGFLLYPALGAISAVTGAALAIRIGAAAVLLLQAMAVYRGARATIGHRGMSVAAAAAVTCSIHGMTNLYNRAALPEFFAVALLAAAVGWLFAATGAEPRRRAAHLALATLCGVMTVGSHPPTALIAAGLALPAVIIGAVMARGKIGRRAATGLAALAGVAVAAIAPWVLANARHGQELGIVGKFRGLSYSPDRVDSWAARFSPLPHDPWIAAGGALDHGTPHVEAPVQAGLIVLAITLGVGAWRGRGAGGAGWARWVAAAGLAWFAGMLVLSMSERVGAAFARLGPFVQFGTRFVSHANLGLLIAVLALGVIAVANAASRRSWAWVAALATVLALTGAAAKWPHAAVVASRGGEPQHAWSGARDALVTGGRADGAGDYAATRRAMQLAPLTAAKAASVALPVGSGRADFARVGEARFELTEPGWVVTNVVRFPWNRLLLDGRPVPPENLIANEFRAAFRAPAGAHRLGWEWRPDAAWRAATVLSRLAVLALAAAALTLAVRGYFFAERSGGTMRRSV